MKSQKAASKNNGMLQGFQVIGPSTYYLEAPKEGSLEATASTSGSAAIPSPMLIILCTWVNAAFHHISKYTSVYKTKYQYASQIVITTSLADMTYRPGATQQKRLSAALTVISENITKGKPTTTGEASQSFRSEEYYTPRIILHIFSHGGSHTACQLASAWSLKTNEPLPHTVMILDSTPGHDSYKRTLNAFVLSLPRSKFVRLVGLPVGHGLIATGWVVTKTFNQLGYKNVVQRLRKGLDDERLFGTGDKKMAKRIYLYSKADEMVWWEDIEEHANEAERRGVDVTRARFERSPHAAHILEDAEKYWGTITEVWNTVAE